MGWVLKLAEFWLVWGGITFLVTLLSAVIIGRFTGFGVIVVVFLASVLSLATVGIYVIWRVYSEQAFTVTERLELVDYEEQEDTFW